MENQKLISRTENKTKQKKPPKSKKGEDAFQPPAIPWWVSCFPSS